MSDGILEITADSQVFVQATALVSSSDTTDMLQRRIQGASDVSCAQISSVQSLEGGVMSRRQLESRVDQYSDSDSDREAIECKEADSSVNGSGGIDAPLPPWIEPDISPTAQPSSNTSISSRGPQPIWQTNAQPNQQNVARLQSDGLQSPRHHFLAPGLRRGGLTGTGAGDGAGAGAVRAVAVTASFGLLDGLEEQGSSVLGGITERTGGIDVRPFRLGSASAVRWAVWAAAREIAEEEAVAAARGVAGPTTAPASRQAWVPQPIAGPKAVAPDTGRQLGFGNFPRLARGGDLEAARQLGLLPVLTALMQLMGTGGSGFEAGYKLAGRGNRPALARLPASGLLHGSGAPRAHQALALRLRPDTAAATGSMRGGAGLEHRTTAAEARVTEPPQDLPWLGALAGSARRAVAALASQAHPTTSLERCARAAGLPLATALGAADWLRASGLGVLLRDPLSARTRLVPSRRGCTQAEFVSPGRGWTGAPPASIHVTCLLGVAGSGCVTLGELTAAPWRLAGALSVGSGRQRVSVAEAPSATDAVDAARWALAVGLLRTRAPRPLLCLPVDEDSGKEDATSQDGATRLGGGQSRTAQATRSVGDTNESAVFRECVHQYLQSEVLGACSLEAASLLRAVLPHAHGRSGLQAVGREVDKTSEGSSARTGKAARAGYQGGVPSGVALVEAAVAAFPSILIPS